METKTHRPDANSDTRTDALTRACARTRMDSLGIETEGRSMSTVVKRNTPIPVRKSDTFTTTVPAGAPARVRCDGC